MPTIIDLFAGCGGMTAGFKSVGFDPVYAVEFNRDAAATYAANFGEEHTFYGDIADVDVSELPEADAIIGGPPCQGFSNLGSRDIRDPRNQLWREYVRIVTAVRPKVFVIENVDRFMRSPEFALLVDEAEEGSLSEYKLEYRHLNAADFGAGQRRLRTIVIGSRIGPVKLPDETHTKDPQPGTGLTRWTSVYERIGKQGIPEIPKTTELPETTVSFFGETIPGTFKGNDIHLGRRPTPLSLERYDHIPPGGGRFDLPEHLLPRCWREKKSGTTDVMGRMRWDQPSLTIRTEFFKPEKGQYLHPQWDVNDSSRRVNRPITHLEAALLQGFSEDFLWCGSKIEIARQIGNAVPVELAQAIAKQLLKHL